jgi:hypothetical protein
MPSKNEQIFSYLKPEDKLHTKYIFDNMHEEKRIIGQEKNLTGSNSYDFSVPMYGWVMVQILLL